MNKLVPVEPTKEMVIAWHKAYEKAQWNANSWDSAFSVAHKAMLEASPPVEVEPVAISQDSIELLAMELASEEHDDIHQLIWEGGPIPEPWGEVWQKYEDDAKSILTRAAKYLPMRYDTSPPDTEAKLKIAVKALNKVNAYIDTIKANEENIEVGLALGIVIDQALKDIGEIK